MKSSQRNSAGLPAGRPGRGGRPVDPPQARGQTQIMSVPTLQWLDPPRGPAVALLDQTRLPAEEKVFTCENVPELVRRDPPPGDPRRAGPRRGRCVRRGSGRLPRRRRGGRGPATRRGPADRGESGLGHPPCTGCVSGRARPRIGAKPAKPDPQRLAAGAALDEARTIAAEDAAASAAMARHGLGLIPEGARVLTHCNTGSLVSAGGGTAFAVILAAHRAGLADPAVRGRDPPPAAGSQAYRL